MKHAVVDTLNTSKNDPNANVKRRVVNFFRNNKDRVVTTDHIVKATKQSKAKVESTLKWMNSQRAIRPLGVIATELDANNKVARLSETWIADDVYEIGKYHQRAKQWLGIK